MRILVVEDHQKIASFVQSALSSAGYVCDVAGRAADAEILAAENEYACAIVDVMLPDRTGFEAASALRQNPGFRGRILFLSALGSVQDKVKGLDSGGDDYMTKPFAVEELLARVRALLRRGEGQESENTLRFEDLELCLRTRTAKREGREIPLTGKEFSLLEVFLRNPNRVLSRSFLSEQVWKVSFDTDSNIVDVYVNLLRKKVDKSFARRYIHTVVGAGYALRSSP